MAFAAWLNSLVLFIMASLLLGLMYFAGDRFPEYFRIKADGPMRWWFILPGMMGFAIVFNLPLSMRAIGAFPTIIALLLGQLVASFIFDTVSQNQPISWARLLGLGFAAVGAYLSFRPAA